MKNVFKKLVDLKNNDKILICEISGNHSNSFSHLKKLITKTVDQKVDLVKFQVYTPDSLTIDSDQKNFLIKSGKWSKQKTLYKLFEKSYTPWSWIKKLTKILEKNSINWFASAFDKSSVDFLEGLNCKAYKIASPEITDVNLIEYIAKKKKPVVFSTGMSKVEDINLAVKIIKKYHNKFAILKCTSKYPASYNDLNLLSIKKLKKKYNCPVGFSDHTIDELSSILAISYGAKIVEKHFKLDKDVKSTDSHFSMPISKYENLKKKISAVDICLGKENKIFSVSRNVLNSRRSLYICENVKKNNKVNSKNVRSIRPGFGIHPKYLKKIIGKKFTKNFKKGTPLKLKYLK
jgi:pseudaminic acid synthase